MRRARKWGMAAAVAAGVAGWALWPRGVVTNAAPAAAPRTASPEMMVEFVSAPVRAYGETVRYKILLPIGWTARAPGRFSDRKLAKAGADGNVYCALSAVPPAGALGLESQAFLIVGHDGKKRSDASSTAALGVDGSSVSSRATASVFQRGRRYEIEYCRGNRAEFDATYERILKSFRVVPGTTADGRRKTDQGTVKGAGFLRSHYSRSE